MKKIIKKDYIFLVLFLVIILSEPIYKLFTIQDNIYNTVRCKILEDDYNKLLKFSEIDYVYESDYLNTLVIYKDIYDYMSEITIRGGKDKEFSSNPVIYDNTLLGVITKVNKYSSIVRLLNNKLSKISVKINDEVGLLTFDGNNLVVKNISNLATINTGDIIYTSGLGNIKENIYIGTVKRVESTNKNIEKLIIVDYKVNIKDVNYVTVIKENI